MRTKITVVGAGNVGATCAQRLAERDYADVVLVDIVEGIARGKALDLSQAGPVSGYEARISGTNDYADTSGSDVVIITSGFPRQPGMSRDDLLAKNKEVVSGVAAQVKQRSPNAIVIVVTNPLDAMCHAVYDVAQFPRERLIGMAGILDTARFRTFIAWELAVSVRDVTALVLGGHGDTMVPIVSSVRVGGVPVRELLPEARIEAIVQRTRDGGAEVVKLLEKGSAFYAPAAATVEMVDAILLDQRRVLPCAALCHGEYGIDELFVGVPVRLGREGMEGIVEMALEPSEQAALESSAAAVRELVEAMQYLA
jgi:malate dehydrogenase